MTCKHGVYIGWLDYDDGLDVLRWYGCRLCGQRLPFPPANDAPADPNIAAAMHIEQRALDWYEHGLAPMRDVPECVCSGCQTRRLVNAIAGHDEEHKP